MSESSNRRSQTVSDGFVIDPCGLSPCVVYVHVVIARAAFRSCYLPHDVGVTFGVQDDCTFNTDTAMLTDELETKCGWKFT